MTARDSERDPTRDEEAVLLAELTAHPDDAAVRLVYADWLIARGDRRGELILLDHLEATTRGGLTDPDQLAALLRLAAELGFPRIPDPDAALLAFEQIGHGDHYRMFHGGRRYELRRNEDELSLTTDDQRPIYSEHYALAGWWSDRTTTVVLSIARRAIVDGAPFEQVAFPGRPAVERHPAYRVGPFPRYYSPEIAHTFEVDHLLQARDRARWYAIYARLDVALPPSR